MDGLSVAANIISIVTAGVRSAVVIREILNGIKDGPAHVRELGIKVDEVSGLLKQLKVLQQHVSGNELDELSTMTQRCAAELETFEGKISKLRNVPGDRRWAKVRKGLKTILKEDDFLSMSRRLSHYIGVFGVQLGILGACVSGVILSRCFVVLINNSLKNLEGNAQLAHLHDDVSGLRDQSALVSASKKLKDFKDATTIELKNSNSTLHQHTVVLQSIEGNLTGMREDASNHKGLIQSQHQDALRVFKGVEAKMDHMVNMSTGQSNAIIGLLEQLIAVRSTPTNHLSTISLPSAGGEGVAGRELAVRKDSDDEFSQSINRLCSLVGMKRTTINSSEAEVIINDLEKILDTVSRLPDLTSRKRLRHGEYDRDEGSREDSRDIKKMKKMITSSPPIELDQKGSDFSPLRQSVGVD